MQYVNGYDHPNILAGQGTMGLEILDQVPDVEAIVIPVGGGGLIAGTAKAVKTMKPDVMIIGIHARLLCYHGNDKQTQEWNRRCVQASQLQ